MSAYHRENRLADVVRGYDFLPTPFPVNQLTAGLICVGVEPAVENAHWRGLTFYNSTIRVVRDNFQVHNVSASSLKFVDILYAGVNASMNHSAALSASPHPPRMDNLRVKFSAFDGLNFTESKGKVHLSNSEISHNRGKITLCFSIALVELRPSSSEGHESKMVIASFGAWL